MAADAAIEASGLRKSYGNVLALDGVDLQVPGGTVVFLLLRHALPVMRRGSGGRIVLIGSINGSRGKFGLAAYASSKAGLIGLAKSVARETARFGILVNVVEPGMVRTPMTDALPAAVREEAAKESLLGRLLEPEDVAATVLFLCGPGGSQITGQIVRVDGGQYLGGF